MLGHDHAALGPLAEVEHKSQIEGEFQILVGTLAAVCPQNASKVRRAVDRVNGFLFGVAFAWFHGKMNDVDRVELARCVVQTWHWRMLGAGFNSYLENGCGRPFTPYAISTLCNLCVDSLQRKVRDERNTTLHLRGVLDCWDPRQDPVRKAEIQELEHDCSAALRLLPQHQRESVELTYFEGLPAKVVAERLGTTPQTIARWNFHARQQLAPFFRSRGHWPL